MIKQIALALLLCASLASAQESRRRLNTLTWFFPGLPVAGVQAPILTIPAGLQGCSVLGAATVIGTVAAVNSIWNVQRCTANCDGSAAATYTDIWAADLTQNNDKYAVQSGNYSTTNSVCGLTTFCAVASADLFKVDISTVGAATADYTVTLSYACDN